MCALVTGVQTCALPICVEAENFAGTGGFSVLEQPEVTVTYEQRIERGGKREARLAYASRGLDLAEAQARLRRPELAQPVQRAFIDVQIAAQFDRKRDG